MTMIEKICIAMCKEEGIDPHAWFNDNFGWMTYEHLAIAALNAMKEPSDEMYKAIDEAEEICGNVEISNLKAFELMLNAALSEHKNSETV